MGHSSHQEGVLTSLHNGHVQLVMGGSAVLMNMHVCLRSLAGLARY